MFNQFLSLVVINCIVTSAVELENYVEEDGRCTEISHTFEGDYDHSINVPNGCILDVSEGEEPACDSDEFPKTCTLKLKDVVSLIKTAIDTPENTSDFLAISSDTWRRRKPNRHKQFVWASKAIKKMIMHGKACKPATRGKRPPWHMGCKKCCAKGWWSWICRPCHCGCGGATQVGNMCFEKCGGAYSQDTLGFYCHKPCNQEGQLALTVGCKHGHARVCVKDSMSCFMSVLDQAMAFGDILLFVGSAGSSTAISKAVTTARKSGMKAGLIAMRKALWKTAQGIARKMVSRRFLTKQMKKAGRELSRQTKDFIFENGASLLLAGNLPKTDYGQLAVEIASAVDPTGLVGFGATFIPPKGCDEMVVMKDPFPGMDSDGENVDVFGETAHYE